MSLNSCDGWLVYYGINKGGLLSCNINAMSYELRLCSNVLLCHMLLHIAGLTLTMLTSNTSL